jgi:hypothetical protein
VANSNVGRYGSSTIFMKACGVNMLRIVLIGLLAAGAAACTTAPTGAKSASSEVASDAGAQAASPQEHKICRDLGTTGSYGPRHVCKTKAEWDKIDALG